MSELNNNTKVGLTSRVVTI